MSRDGMDEEVARMIGDSLFDTIATEALATIERQFADHGTPLVPVLREVVVASIAAGVAHTLQTLGELGVVPRLEDS